MIDPAPAAVPEIADAIADPARTSMLKVGALTVSSSAVTLISNLGTGVLVARVLGASGRGASTAIVTSTQVFAWFFLVGSVQTISYFQARAPENGATLLGTWLCLIVPCSVLGIALGELLLPVFMAAQTEHTIDTARWFMLTVVIVLLTELVSGYILGSKRFALFNLLRTVTPLAVAVVYLGLWRLDALSVASAVWSFAAVQGLAILVALALCVSWHGVARPDWGLARETVWYGIRAHSANVSTLLTARLDLLIMPAFLSASQVGLYSVATNVSWIVFALSGSLALIVLPMAASAGSESTATVIRGLQGTTLVAVSLGAIIAILASVAVRIAYGTEFASCVSALRLLLPGSVLYAMALVVVSGLYVAHRPFIAAATQGVGLLATAVGLLIFLRAGGIEAAAIVSTVSYTLVFVTATLAYRRVTGLAWGDFLPGRSSRRAPDVPE